MTTYRVRVLTGSTMTKLTIFADSEQEMRKIASAAGVVMDFRVVE